MAQEKRTERKRRERNARALSGYGSWFTWYAEEIYATAYLAGLVVHAVREHRKRQP